MRFTTLAITGALIVGATVPTMAAAKKNASRRWSRRG